MNSTTGCTPAASQPRPACVGRTQLYDAIIDSPSDPHVRREAALLCRTCPLGNTCLTNQTDQYWAAAAHGILREIIRIRRGLPIQGGRNKATCGTDGGYYRHRRALKEPACDQCVEAHRIMSALREARKRQAAA